MIKKIECSVYSLKNCSSMALRDTVRVIGVFCVQCNAHFLQDNATGLMEDNSLVQIRRVFHDRMVSRNLWPS